MYKNSKCNSFKTRIYKKFHERILDLGNNHIFCRLQECAVSGKKYTYNELRVLSRRFAASLRKEGFRPGNVISILLPNIPDYAIVVLGALQAGMILSPINPIYTQCRCNILLEHCRLLNNYCRLFNALVDII